MKQTINQSQTNTREKKKENFFKKHWKKIVVATVVICGVTVSAILLNKNGNKLAKIFECNRNKTKTLSKKIHSSQTQAKIETAQDIINDIIETTEKERFPKISHVKGHPMRLANGKKAAPAKQEIIRIYFPECDVNNYTYREKHERNYNKVA